MIPASWNFDPTNDDILEINDTSGQAIGLQENEATDKTWRLNSVNPNYAEILDKDGKLLRRQKTPEDQSNCRIIEYEGTPYLLPENKPSPQVAPLEIEPELIENVLHDPEMSDLFAKNADMVSPDMETPDVGSIDSDDEMSEVDPMISDDDCEMSDIESPISSPEPSLPPSTPLTPQSPEQVGRKRKQRSTGSPAAITPLPVQKKTRTEEEITDLDSAVCWRVHPTRLSFFQILNQEEEVIHEEAVETFKGKRKLINGFFVITHDGSGKKSLRRNPDDKKDLVANSFDPTRLDNVQIWNAIKPLTASIVNKAVCWRIHPNKTGFFQLLDQKNNVVYERQVKNRKRIKKLADGKLSLTYGSNRSKKFARHPKDKADITQHDFAPIATQDIEVYVPNKAQPSSNKKKSKATNSFNDIDFNEVLYWRIAPNNLGFFQLIDKNNEVIYKGKIRLNDGKRRRLHRGTLKLMQKRRQYTLKRHQEDTEDLTANGFDPETISDVKIFGKKTKRATRAKNTLTPEIAEKALCWRIAPNNTDDIQLLDKDGTVIHQIAIKIHTGKRKMKFGYMSLGITNGTVQRFKRHPEDRLSLEGTDFALNQTARTLDPKKEIIPPWITEPNPTLEYSVRSDTDEDEDL